MIQRSLSRNYRVATVENPLFRGLDLVPRVHFQLQNLFETIRLCCIGETIPTPFSHFVPDCTQNMFVNGNGQRLRILIAPERMDPSGCIETGYYIYNFDPTTSVPPHGDPSAYIIAKVYFTGYLPSHRTPIDIASNITVVSQESIAEYCRPQLFTAQAETPVRSQRLVSQPNGTTRYEDHGGYVVDLKPRDAGIVADSFSCSQIFSGDRLAQSFRVLQEPHTISRTDPSSQSPLQIQPDPQSADIYQLSF